MARGRRVAVTAGVAVLLAVTGAAGAAAAPSSPPPTPGILFPTTPTTPEHSSRAAAPSATPAVVPNGYDVPTFAYDVARTGKDPSETVLGPSTVGGLTQRFATSFANAGAVDAPPIGASAVLTPSGTRDLLYVGNEHGAFGAIDATTGEVVWEVNVGYQHTGCEDFVNGDAGVTGSAVLDRPSGRVFVAGGDGRLYAFDMATGAPATGWPNPVVTTTPNRLHDYGALTLDSAHHRLYVTLASYCDFTPYKGQVVSVDSRTGGALRRFVVVKDTQYGGGIWGWGGVSLDATGNVFVSTGNALPDGPTEATPYAEYVLKLGPYFGVLGAHHPTLAGKDMDFGSTPTLIDVPGCQPMLAVQNKNGHLYLYRRNSLAAGPAQNLAVVTTLRLLFVGMPAYDPVTRVMYVSASSPGALPQGMQARRFGSTCQSSPLWNTQAGPAASPVSSPTIADGVVYYADGTGRTVHAFDAATGTELWHSADGTFTGDTYSAPLVFDGRVYVASRGGALHAFG